MIFSGLKKERKELMKNKRYFLYALGEVALIVVGILVAIQVDNWREDIANRRKIEKYYTLIENDLNDQIAEIEFQVKSELEILRESEKLITAFSTNKRFITDDQYTSSIGNINNWRTFLKIDPAFEQLLATGDVGLIPNEDLKKNIFSYYHQLRKVEAVITENHAYVISSFSPLILKVSNHSLPNFQSDLYKKIVKLGYVPDDIDKVLSKNTESENYIQETTNKDNVQLELCNAIKMRYRISAVHLSYLEDLKERTLSLKTEVTSNRKD